MTTLVLDSSPSRAASPSPEPREDDARELRKQQKKEKKAAKKAKKKAVKKACKRARKIAKKQAKCRKKGKASGVEIAVSSDCGESDAASEATHQADDRDATERADPSCTEASSASPRGSSPPQVCKARCDRSDSCVSEAASQPTEHANERERIDLTSRNAARVAPRRHSPSPPAKVSFADLQKQLADETQAPASPARSSAVNKKCQRLKLDQTDVKRSPPRCAERPHRHCQDVEGHDATEGPAMRIFQDPANQSVSGAVHMMFEERAERLLDAAQQAAREAAPLGTNGKRTTSTSSGDVEQRAKKARVAPAFGSGPHVPGRVAGGGPLSAARAALPVHGYKDSFVATVKDNQVVVVEGDTGCGKTTQLPQYLLEAAAEAGQPCGIIVTQPRRVSAIGVAERVAEERGERCGDSVGYAIRLNTCSSSATSLLYCTTGVLLRRLEGDSELKGLTHVFADEVHERSVESDLLLLALAQLRHRRPELRVILMSATLDSDLFSRYFGCAPRFKIPGRTFPVKALFLEDAIEMTQHVIDRHAEWAARKRVTRRRFSGHSDVHGHASSQSTEDLSSGSVMQRYSGYSSETRRSLSALDHDVVDYDLAAQLVGHFLRQRPPVGPRGQPLGAILVFLSGAKEIETMKTALVEVNPQLGKEPCCSWILTLHSTLSADEQRQAFQQPPKDVRKIVLATNIAETSITIDDVGVVVDTGHMKELRYDPLRRIASLEDVFVSKASARQRRGRAGRVGPGTCVHLVTKFCHDELMAARPDAEVRRVSLQQLILRMHAAGEGLLCGFGAEAACARLIEAPAASSVKRSVEELIGIGALAWNADTQQEAMTQLGHRLAELPLDAQVAKLLVLAIPFGRHALDSALTLAASLAAGSPFLPSFERKFEARRQQWQLAEKLAFGGLGCSDFLAVLQAYNEWSHLPFKERPAFCQQRSLRAWVLREMSDTKRHLMDALSDAGLIPNAWRGNLRGAPSAWRAGDFGQGPTEHVVLVAALLCGALFPNVALVMKKDDTVLADMGYAARCAPVEIFVRDIAEHGKFTQVQIHPASVAAKEKFFGSPFLVYHTLVKTGKAYLRDVLPAPALALALFAGLLAPGVVRQGASNRASSLSEMTVGGWIQFAVKTRVLHQIFEVRASLNALLRTVLERGAPRSEREQEARGRLMTAFAKLLSLPAAGP
eukprot:TRINITY_DN63810_c0_g1_i1.p1 TRINITY_DN63810_c0_g1~~TRINITY_DN63810_c0_g1_i1.p1  ORF type:complete len:1179 (-),score=232.83 TRINITY_DN63810_c0_g1_i1:252-3788(-)